MAVTEKIKRPLIAHFLDVGETFGEYSAATWARLGKNVTEASTDYGAQTETEQDIIGIGHNGNYRIPAHHERIPAVYEGRRGV